MSIHISIPMLLVFASPNAVANSEKALRELEGKVDIHSRSAIYSLYITDEEKVLHANEYAMAPGQYSCLTGLLDEVCACPVVMHHNFIQAMYIADSDSMNISALAQIHERMQAWAESMKLNLNARFAWIVHGNIGGGGPRAIARQAKQLEHFQTVSAWKSLQNLIVISDKYDNNARVEYNLYKVAVLAALKLSMQEISDWMLTLSFAKIGKPQEEIDRMLRYSAAARLKKACLEDMPASERLFAQELADFFACGHARRGTSADKLNAMTRNWVKKLLPRPIDALAMPRGESETNIERLENLARSFVEDNITNDESAIMNAARAQLECVKASVMDWIARHAHIGEAVSFFAPGGVFDALIEDALRDTLPAVSMDSTEGSRKGLLEKTVDYQNKIILRKAKQLIDQESVRLTGSVLREYRSMRAVFYEQACACRNRALDALNKYDMDAAEYAGLKQELSAYDRAIDTCFDEGRVSAEVEAGDRVMYPNGVACTALWEEFVEVLVGQIQQADPIFLSDFWANIQDREGIMNKVAECAQNARPLLFHGIGISEVDVETRYIPERFSELYTAAGHHVVWVSCDSVEVLKFLSLTASCEEDERWRALKMCPAFSDEDIDFADDLPSPMHSELTEKQAQAEAADSSFEKTCSESDSAGVSVFKEGRSVYASWIWQGGPRADATITCRDGSGNTKEAVCTSGQFAVGGNRLDITNLIGYGRNEISVRQLNMPGTLTGSYVRARKVYYELRRTGSSKAADGDEKIVLDAYRLALWAPQGVRIGKSVTDRLCLSRAAEGTDGSLKYRLDFECSRESRHKGEDKEAMECVFQGISVPREKAIALSVLPEYKEEIELSQG